MKKPSHRKPHRPHNARHTRAQRPSTPQAGGTLGDGYLARLMAAARTGGLVRAGEVTTVTVSHEDGCQRPRGGACTCRPDIDALTGDGRLLTIDHDGEAVAVRKS
jgi:hypothetical protein